MQAKRTQAAFALAMAQRALNEDDDDAVLARLDEVRRLIVQRAMEEAGRGR